MCIRKDTPCLVPIRIHTYIHTYNVCVALRLYIYTHTHARTHTHTHTHKYIHTPTPTPVARSCVCVAMSSLSHKISLSLSLWVCRRVSQGAVMPCSRAQRKTRGNPDRGTRVPAVHSTHPAASSRPARSLCDPTASHSHGAAGRERTSKKCRPRSGLCSEKETPCSATARCTSCPAHQWYILDSI